MRKAFTLTELIVVIAIIGIIMAMALPFLSGATRDAEFKFAVSKVEGMLKVARQRALSRSPYGVCFYVDSTVGASSIEDKQHAVFVKHGGNPVGDPDSNTDMGPYWEVYAGRFTPDIRSGTYTFPAKIRVRNNMPDQPKRNVFMIIFEPNGEIWFSKFHFILYDATDNGFGDITGLPVNDLSSWQDPQDCPDDEPGCKKIVFVLGDPVPDIVDLDSNDGHKWTAFEGSRSLIVYDHAAWVDLLLPGDSSAAEKMLDREAIPLYVNKYGHIIELERGDLE